MDLEHRIIGRNRFETDVGVPACAGEAAYIRELMREAAAFLLLLTADDADLITELGPFFCKGMNV